MPPHLQRFPGGPNNLYQQQQFPGHAPSHSGSHAPPLPTNPAYLNPNAGLNPFGANGNVLGLGGGGLNTGGGGSGAGFGMGGSAAADTGLASHAARMSFAHAGGLQQQQQQAAQQQQQHSQQQQQHHGPQQGHGAGGLVDHPTRAQAKGRIREVWKYNLHEEMAVLRDLVEKYPCIAMDTEFPGVVSRPMGNFRGKSDYHYQCLRTNVDMLNVIQIGLALFNEDGETPPARPTSTDSLDLGLAAGRRNGVQGPFPYAWQFNFKFSLKDDMYNQTSIDSLQAAGIDFAALERDGIDPHEFAALLIPSGLVCFENAKWVSFHGGYDFGYLTKLLICRPLPNDEVEFDQIMKLHFPSTYDVKHLLKHAIKLNNSGVLTPTDPGTVEILQKFEHKSGLENIAEALRIKRVGAAHQAGSDSLLTGRVFFALRERIFNGDIADEHVGKVWGLGFPDSSGSSVGFSTGPSAAGGGTRSQVDGSPPGQEGGGAGGQAQQQQNGSGGGGGGGGTPSTPNTASAGLVTTPAAHSHNTNNMGMGGMGGGMGGMGGMGVGVGGGGAGGGMGPLTPGGGGGVFGNFAFAGSNRS